MKQRLTRPDRRRSFNGQMSLRSFHLVFLATAALLLTPSVASAAWTVTPSPNVPGPETTLSGVDCSSPRSCTAVGSSHSGSGTPLDSAPVVEHWDGTSWQIMPSPNTFGGLNGISCPRANFCFAVGFGGANGGMIERWDGTSWSIQPSPPDVSDLLDVSCSGLLACTAVGYASTGNTGPNTRTLAERWDGTGWHVQSTPNPTGSDSSQLSSVSCPLKRTCTAVGQSTRGRRELAPRRALVRARQFVGDTVRAEARRRRERCAQRRVLSGRTGVFRRRKLFCPGDPGRAPSRLDVVGHAHPESAALSVFPRTLRRQLSGTSGVSRRRHLVSRPSDRDRRALRRSELAARGVPDQWASEFVAG